MHRTERIVLIDDNEMDNIYHTWVIKNAGFTGKIVVYDSGQAALKGLGDAASEARTFIFLDINMPGMDGFEVAEKLDRILVGSPNVTLVMLTSSSAVEDIARARTIRMIRGCLTKPLTEEMVVELLGAVDWDTMPATLNTDLLWLQA
jgi:CheY-like chemotaxis protein